MKNSGNPAAPTWSLNGDHNGGLGQAQGEQGKNETEAEAGQEGSEGETEMKIQEIKSKVAEIETLATIGDDEAAHEREDSLLVLVLREIASGAKNAQGLASEAIKTQEIVFSRWCG